MKLYLGVDGGQSGTAAVLGDETGRILGRGEAGPCNHTTVAEGRARFEGAIDGSFAAACREAGLNPSSVHLEAACFGMSGGPEDKRAILEARFRGARVLVTNDAVIALSGATARGQGIITIAGTGSIAWGRNAEGRTARAGGWGYIFGDEGSAFDIVRQSLRAAIRMEEGWGPATRLRDVLLEATGAATANDTLHLFYTPEWHRSRVARLAPLVDQAAVESDAVALHILNAAAQDLATFAASVRNQLWTPAERVDVAFIGGVFQSRILLERFRTLVELDEMTRCGPPRHGPAEGALLEAYRSSGLEVTLV